MNQLFYIIFFLLIACENNTVSRIELPNNGNKKLTIEQKNNYKRDSLLIVLTAFHFVENQIFPTGGYKSFNTKNELINWVDSIYVDTIFYSPDSLKLIAPIIIKERNDTLSKYIEYNPDRKIVFGGQNLVGFRKSKKEIWSIYPISLYTPIEWKYYLQVSNLLRHFYFYELSSKSISITDTIIYKNEIDHTFSKHDSVGRIIDTVYEREAKSVTCKSPVNDSTFWTESPIWNKNFKYKSLYDFQTRIYGNDVKILKHKKVVYPDSLIRLYK